MAQVAHEENYVCAALAELCRQHNVTCLVQVGAGDGYEAYYVMRELGCRAIAIEADARNVATSPALEFHHALIGATDCMTVFYQHKNAGLSSQHPRGDGTEHASEIKQQRLDTFCQEHNLKPDALIIDTEGTTLEVLEGCGALLDNIKLVYAECQTYKLRPGIRLVQQIDELLAASGMTQHLALPSYGCKEAQGNWTWVRK